MYQKGFGDLVMAKLFGFPQCCVDFYINADPNALRRAKGFDGYRLCPACTGKSLEQVVNDLATRRIAAEPFPFMPTEESYPALLTDSRFDASERAWLAQNKSRVIGNGRDHFDNAIFGFHQVMTELRERTEKSIQAEPARRDYFLADQELGQQHYAQQLLDFMHARMLERVKEQIAEGTIKL